MPIWIIISNPSYSWSQEYIDLQCLLNLLLVTGNTKVVWRHAIGYLSSFSVQAGRWSELTDTGGRTIQQPQDLRRQG